MSFIDRIRHLFSGEVPMDSESQAALPPPSPEEEANIWLDSKFRALRMRHEWLMNGKAVRPWRLHAGSNGSGSVAQMIERYVHVSVPKAALAVAWDGKEWTFHSIIDTAYASVMPAFIPLTENSLNPDMALVYMTPVGAPANGALYAVLQAEGMQTPQDLYLGMHLTTFANDPLGNKEADQHYFTYDQNFRPEEIRKLTLKRMTALDKDIHDQHLDAEELMALGWVDPFEEVEQGRQLCNEGQTQRGIAKLFEGFCALNRLTLRHVIGKESTEVFTAARYLGEAYYYDKLYTKALFFLELADYGLNKEGKPDALLEDCKLRVRDFRMSKRLSDYDKPGEWTARKFSRFGMVLECCLSVPEYNLRSMAIIVDGNSREPIIVDGGDEIFSYDILALAKDATLVQAFVAIADGRIMIVELRQRRSLIDMSILITSDAGLNLSPHCMNMAFGTHHWVSRDEFIQMRTEAAQRLVEGEPMLHDDPLLLGECENAHLYWVRAKAAAQADAWGDALYYLHKSYFDLTERLGKQDLEHWDLGLIGHVCYQLGFTFSETGSPHQALSYLYKLENSQNESDLAELANNLCMVQDLRAVTFLKTKILDQKIKANNNGGVNTNPAFMRYMRGRLAFALIDRNRVDDAKRELGSLMCEPDKMTQEFAAEELQKLIDAR